MISGLHDFRVSKVATFETYGTLKHWNVETFE